MCGIVGAVSTRNIVPILVQGLQRLEYRGYDSCGVAVHADGLKRARSTVARGRTADPGASDEHRRAPPASPTRAGPRTARRRCTTPTRTSATARARRGSTRRPRRPGAQRHHRKPRRAARRAARPRATCSPARPTPRSSPTWSTACYDGDLFEAVKAAVKQLHGAYAIAVFCKDEPHRVVGARAGSPLILGVGKEGGENFLASDAMALAGVTDQIVYLEEGDVVDLQLGKYWIVDKRPQAGRRARCRPCRRTAARPSWAPTATTCKRKSSSSRAPSPTRWKACRASCPSCSATARQHARASRKSTRC